MVEITDETKCCGCTSCVNACPKGAIDMVPDKEGNEMTALLAPSESPE